MKRLITLFLMLCFWVGAFAQARPKVAVLDFRTESPEAIEYVRRASDIFSMNFNNPFAVDVVQSGRFVAEASAKGYDVVSLTDAQIVAVGNAMGINDVITCVIAYDGSSFTMQMKMIGMLSQTVRCTDTAVWANGASCVEPVKALAERMLAALSKPETNSVAPSAAPSQTYAPAAAPASNSSVQQRQINVAGAVESDVVILYGFLAVFPEDIGEYSSIPNFVIAGVNADNTYGRNDWRVPTNEEMSLILASSAKVKNIRKDVQYLTSDGSGSGVLRLVANLNESAPAPQPAAPAAQPAPQPAAPAPSSYQTPAPQPAAPAAQPVPQPAAPAAQPAPQPAAPAPSSYQTPAPQPAAPAAQPVPQPAAPAAQPTPQPAAPAAPAVPDTGFYDGRLVVKGIEYPMVYVAGGTYTMGNDQYTDQKPSHQVTLTGYYIGKFEVTQALWVAIMGNNPCPVEDDSLPVESVSWDECQQFIKILSEMTGKQFKLPTEAQWEFAAKGGNFSKGYEYSGSDNAGEVAWNGSNSGGETHKVGLLKPNELGLHDMSGNVMEWCSDYYGQYSGDAQTNPTGPVEGYNRVVRGGCWHNTFIFGKVDYRSNVPQSARSANLGFRLVL